MVASWANQDSESEAHTRGPQDLLWKVGFPRVGGVRPQRRSISVASFLLEVAEFGDSRLCSTGITGRNWK